MRGVLREIQLSYTACEEVYEKPCGFKTGDNCENCETLYDDDTEAIMDALEEKGYSVWDIYEIEMMPTSKTFAVLITKDDGGRVPRVLPEIESDEDSGLDLPKMPHGWIEKQFAEASKKESKSQE